MQFDDVTKCCGHPSCGVRKPEARTQIMWAGRDVVEGARVVTFWHKTTTAGGLVAVALDVPRGTAEGSAA